MAPKAFRAFIARFPEPFAPALEMFRTFEHYLDPAADVVASVPSLRLDALRARRAAQIWREEQEPAWFFAAPVEAPPRRAGPSAGRPGGDENASLEAILEADLDIELGNAPRETPRDEKDPEVLAELTRLGAATAAAPDAARARASAAFGASGVSEGSRASAREALAEVSERRRNVISGIGGRSDKPAAAEVRDHTASVSYRLDGEARAGAPKRPLGPRALGRGHAAALSAQMRVRDLGHLARDAPGEAVAALEKVSLRARLVALRALAPADAARVLAATAPEARAEAERGLDPETVARARRLIAGGSEAASDDPSRPRDAFESRLPLRETERDGSPNAKEKSRWTGFGARAALDARRAALEALDDSETYVYVGDVENRGGWTRDEDAAIDGSDAFV